MQAQSPLVLIVDDNVTNLKLVEALLKANGDYTPLTTDDPTRVVALCRDNPVDMVLLDIVMPGLNGYQVCAQLKADPATRDIPVIFLTAEHETESIIAGFKAGGVDYLIKPLNGPELIARMGAHMRLRQQEQELKAINATKDRLITIIAEDLRSPIKGLYGIMQMIDRSFDSLSREQLRDYLSLAMSAAEGLDSLSENLIQWSSLYIDETPPHAAPLDLYTLFGNAIAEVQAENPQKALTFHLGIPEGSFVTSDEKGLNIVAQSLLRNAASFSHRGGEIRISARRQAANWQITILDQGVGIDAETQQQLFRLDRRVAHSGTEGEHGSGMGLLLCQQVLQRLNGTIAIASEPDKGTAVTVTLPVNAN